MKTLEKVRLKVLINFVFVICSCFFYAQESKPFYSVKESININNPVIVGIKGYYNLFITDKSNITADLNINKLLEQGKLFLYNEDTTFSDIVTENKQQLGNCNDMSKIYTIKNKYVIFNLPKGITRFSLGFTSFKEYDKRMQNPHEKAYMKITGQYYPIIFPICENPNLTQ